MLLKLIHEKNYDELIRVRYFNYLDGERRLLNIFVSSLGVKKTLFHGHSA